MNFFLNSVLIFLILFFSILKLLNRLRIDAFSFLQFLFYWFHLLFFCIRITAKWMLTLCQNIDLNIWLVITFKTWIMKATFRVDHIINHFVPELFMSCTVDENSVHKICLFVFLLLFFLDASSDWKSSFWFALIETLSLLFFKILFFLPIIFQG